MANGVKLFRDPVHGYIDVTDAFCQRFIDTDVFQRLRFIEQSSMRMLFPGARHDRFIHSLGVYSIAKRIYSTIKGVFEERFEGQTILLKKFEETFLAAALLHDCAHSPFSHTGEKLAKLYCNDDIERKLVAEVNTEYFSSDFYGNDKGVRYATHEMASAYVGCKRFAKAFGDSVDKEQFSRMIVGLKNKTNQSPVAKAFNCLIVLINGFIIDVDRLDYLQRDSWASGICNASVDVERIISGIDVNLEKGWVGIKHTALASVVNAVSARDYIFQWVITHHKVVYVNEMITSAIEHLIEKLADVSGCSISEVGKTIFSPDRLLPHGDKEINGEKIYLPTDSDLIYLMKKYIPEDKCFAAYFYRNKIHVSLWKTYAEFVNIFVPTIEHRYKHLLGDEKFWEFFKGRLQKFCTTYSDCICSEPEEMKITRNKINEIDASLERSYAAEALKKTFLDLSLLFEEGLKKHKFFFSAFLEVSDKITMKESRPITRIRQLQELLNTCLIEYSHL